MKRFLFLLIALVIAVGACSAAESKFEMTLVDKFQKTPTGPVIASRASVEGILYNSVFNMKPVWDNMTREERLGMVDKVRDALASGLGVKIRIKRFEKLKNIELQLLPFDFRDIQIVMLATNLTVTKKGLDTVGIDKGYGTFYKLDGEHLALCSVLEDPQKQLDQFDLLIQKDPRNVDLRLAKAEFLEAYDQRAALKEYERVIEEFPDSAPAYNNLAMIYTGYNNLNLVDPAKALVNAKKACELTHEQEVGHLDTLARAYYMNGDYDKALELTRKNISRLDDLELLVFLEILETHPPVSKG